MFNYIQICKAPKTRTPNNKTENLQDQTNSEIENSTNT